MSQPEPTDPAVVVTRAGAVATVWLNRPEKRNAVTHDMWEMIAASFRDLAADPMVRAVVVRGAGGHFCAGADIGGLGGSAGHAAANADAESQIAGFPKPTIALVTGACVGGGVQIAAACDLRIADVTSRFGVTPARLGIVYPASAVERLQRLVGPSAAKHLLFSAELIDAERALRVGLVDEVLPAGAADERVAALTSLMADQRSLLTQMASKQMVDDIAATGAVSEATAATWRAHLAASDDAAEGIAAFAERRAPRFGWRPPDLTA